MGKGVGRVGGVRGKSRCEGPEKRRNLTSSVKSRGECSQRRFAWDGKSRQNGVVNKASSCHAGGVVFEMKTVKTKAQ